MGLLLTYRPIEFSDSLPHVKIKQRPDYGKTNLYIYMDF